MTSSIETPRLRLDPLRVKDVEEMAALLDDAVVGTVQATRFDEDGRPAAELAWVSLIGHQGIGYAREAAAAMAAWLREQGVEVLVAHVHPEHAASIVVAQGLGLVAGAVRGDGEVRWTSP